MDLYCLPCGQADLQVAEADTGGADKALEDLLVLKKACKQDRWLSQANGQKCGGMDPQEGTSSSSSNECSSWFGRI